MPSIKFNHKVIGFILLAIFGISLTSCRKVMKRAAASAHNSNRSYSKETEEYLNMLVGEWEAWESYDSASGEEKYEFYLYFGDDGRFNFYEEDYVGKYKRANFDVVGIYQIDGNRIKYKVDKDASTFWVDSDYVDADEIKEIRKNFTEYNDDEVVAISSKKMILRDVETKEETVWVKIN